METFPRQNFSKKIQKPLFWEISRNRDKIVWNWNWDQIFRNLKKLEKVSKPRSLETEMSHFVVETWLKWPWQKKMPIHEWLAVLVMFFSDSIITAWRHINVFLIPFFIWFENGYTIGEWQFIGTVFNVGLMIGFKYWAGFYNPSSFKQLA